MWIPKFEGKLTRLKDWLIEYSSIVDFISKILMGMAALYVSYAAYSISQQQLLIAQSQFRLSEINLDPDIYVSQSLVRDETGFAAHTLLEVFNTGGQAHNVDTKFKSFVVVRRDSNPRTVTLVPVVGYYFAQFNKRQPQGSLTVVEGYNSNKQFHAVYLELLKEEVIKKYGFVEIRIETLVTIDYTTRAGAEKRVQFINSARVTDKEIGDYLGTVDKAQRLACYLDIGHWGAARIDETLG